MSKVIGMVRTIPAARFAVKRNKYPGNRYRWRVNRRGSTLDGVRRQNLADVLRHVHRAGRASRAELTATTGLNRSTVAALVAELEDLGLLVEGDPLATSRVGRPSPLVTPAAEPVVLAANPEVDAVTVGVVGLSARVDRVIRRPVERIPTPDDAVDIIADIVEELRAEGALEGRRMLGAGLAVPGLVRAEDHLVRWAPHLGWRDSRVADLVADRLGVPCAAGNDATLGAMAEHVFGAGRGIDDLVYLNGGASGIGGGVVLGGRIVGGMNGYAGEFGQNKPGLGDSTDRLSPDGVLEDEVSRRRLLDALGLEHADEAELEHALLASDDADVLAEVAREQRVLAVALSNAINVLNPSVVILGGFLAALRAADPQGLEELVRAHALEAATEGVRIVEAALGGVRLLIGAAELALAPLLADPARARGASTSDP